MLARAMQSAGTPPRTAPESVMASTTLTTATAPGSGRSAYEFEINIERDFVEPGEGSDIEDDECPVDNRNVDEYAMDKMHPKRLHKIMPIIERLNEKFSSLYQLEQNIAIDESLLLWKGRLSF